MKRQFLSSALALFQDSIKGLKSTPLQSADKRKPTTNSLRKSLFVAMLGAGSLSMAGTASATLIESIAALDEGAMYRVLFVTKATTNAKSDNIIDYNTFVSSAATSGSETSSLGFSWTALASTASVNVQANTGIFKNDVGPVTMFNTFGKIVATSGSSLWSGSLLDNVNRNEDAQYTGDWVWTGSSWNGDTAVTGIRDRISALGSFAVRQGHSGRDSVEMFSTQNSRNNELRHIYGVSAIQSKLTVEAPEPGTVILLSLGLAGLSFARYRRQS